MVGRMIASFTVKMCCNVSVGSRTSVLPVGFGLQAIESMGV